jgi:hypothetical protein
LLEQLKIWRGVDSSTDSLTTGAVDAKFIKKKLSKQLKIDLQPDETIHLWPEPVSYADLDHNPAAVQNILASVSISEPCIAQVKQLGEFVSFISLRGGYTVQLRVEVLKR